jgi:hypothetical protein
MLIAFLGHNQMPGASRPAGGFISPSDAEFLLSQFAVERLTRKCVRAFPPGSAFAGLKVVSQRSGKFNVVGGEIGGCKFVYRRKETGIARVQKLPRYREVFGENQMRAAL